MHETLNEITLGVVNLVLIALGGFVGTAIKRWLRKHGQDEIVVLAGLAVKWAEQTGLKSTGAAKLEAVKNYLYAQYPWLKKHSMELAVAVEAAVNEMRKNEHQG